jgi:hypothetical protein
MTGVRTEDQSAVSFVAAEPRNSAVQGRASLDEQELVTQNTGELKVADSAPDILHGIRHSADTNNCCTKVVEPCLDSPERGPDYTLIRLRRDYFSLYRLCIGLYLDNLRRLSFTALDLGDKCI